MGGAVRTLHCARVSHEDVDTARPERGRGPYPALPSQPDYPALERAVLARWKEGRVFQRSVEARRGSARGEYVFYDGPPFANGLPHYGHLLTGYVKDIVPRYQTMRGRCVERRFGWDCHGLPAEMGAEKELGISGRAKILEYGIGRFNAHCRESVLRYRGEWQRYVERQGRWVDFENDYKTMDLSFMESVLWAFKRLHELGLVYESYRVMPYSWAAESPVSNFETRMDNAYRERQDPALTVRLRLCEPLDGAPAELWIWTTTPWTLPSNLAVAVGPEIDYAVLEKDGRRVVLAAAALAKYERELEGARRVGERKGAALVGRAYEPLFPFFASWPNAFRVLAGDFVDTAEGTGLVHMAPGFGEDDQRVCAENGIEVVCPVDGSGRFTAEVADWQGVNVLEANKPITAALKQKGALVRHDTIVHSYPHCWRTDEPLIYRALSSWYVKVSAFRERMVELNQRIRWVPEHVRDGQFGKWLEGARDWSISRNRFWGSPIPVWKSDDPAYPRVDVYGSLDELERDFGVRPTDLHRPFVDELVRPNPDDPSGKSRMRRVEDVLDGWFESGSMPWGQVHYPFESKAWFESHFPADFITEYVAQTRGWFYTMHVLATALFDREPFRHCVCHGVVVDENGTKLSKRLRNYPEPDAVFETHGSDALRWFLCSSPILRGADLQIDREGKGFAEVVRLVHNPIWNAYAFFCLYANADGARARLRADQEGTLDRYVLAKARQLVLGVEEAMEAYDLARACAAVRGFLDALNNWYIRRSRPRFWKQEQDQDKEDAYDTLYTALVTLCRVAAPFLPFLTDEIHRGLTGEESVHLCDWPEKDLLPDDAKLVERMDFVRSVCSTALGLREQERLRTRLPLPSLKIAGDGSKAFDDIVEFLEEPSNADLIKDEVNVKELDWRIGFDQFADWNLRLNARVLGPHAGKHMKAFLAAAPLGLGKGWTMSPEGIRVLAKGVPEEDQWLREGEGELGLQPKPGLARGLVLSPVSRNAVVVLDTRLTPELEREGLARDLVRLVQQARKDAGLHVSDRVALAVEAAEEVVAALAEHEAYVREQVLAGALATGAGNARESAFRAQAELGGEPLTIGLTRLG